MAVLEVTPEKSAVILVVPTLIWEAIATPSKPAATLMVATVVSDEIHWANFVRSLILPSVYVPVAMNR